MTVDLSTKISEFRNRGARRVKLGLTDIDGVIRGKYLSLDKFESVLAKGGGFCDCVLGWDINDQLYDNVSFTGWNTGFPDARYRLLVDSERWLADEGVPYFIGEFAEDGSEGDHALCPRTRLRAVLDRAQGLGIFVKMAFEYEFFVFAETPHSVREKHYVGLNPITPGNFGYSVLRASALSDDFSGLMDYCAALDCPLEGLHCETGPGVWEGALEACDALTAADRANLFKTFSKVFFQKRGAMATFMAKWSMDYPGQSGHCHFSFNDGEASLFFDAAAPDTMSETQRHALGGLEAYLPEFLSMVAPTVNSYTRLVKGAWAPTALTWGIENRTAAVRVISGSARYQRLECRVPGADANPYLAAAAIVAAAILGVEQGLEPGPPVIGNAYEAEDSLSERLRFPGTLRQAAERLEASEAARAVFGDAFVDHFVASRIWECREYERHVNGWQLDRYFEII